MKRVLYIWLPHWPIQRLVAARTELKSRVILLHRPDARRGERVVACSQAARRRGIGPGMLLAEATALLHAGAADSCSPRRGQRGGGSQPKRGPQRGRQADRARAASPANSAAEPWLAAYDPVADRRGLEQLAGWCERFSPLVGLEEGDAPEGIWLEIAGTACLFGGEQKLAATVTRAFQRRGYHVRVVVADTIGAAWAVARFADASSDRLPTRVVPAGQTQQVLEPLPLAALRLNDTSLSTLSRLGIERIEQLLALPRAGLAARLDTAVLTRLDQALGTRDEVIVAHRPPPQFTVRWSLEHPTGQRAVLQQMLQHLAQHLAALLQAQDCGALQVHCQLDCCEQHQVAIEVGLFRPTADPQHLQELLSMQLETRQLPQPVIGMRLHAQTTAPLPRQQRDLLGESVAERPQQLARFVNRLSSRLGEEAVMQARLRAGALPEAASVTRPCTDPRPWRGNTCPPAAPHARPLCLRDPPLPIEVVAVAPEGPPVWFLYHQQRFEVAWHEGPERIETAWWHGECVRRDYYRVQTPQGSQFWLFRQRQEGQWFLHGEFL